MGSRTKIRNSIAGKIKVGIKYCGGCNPLIDRKRLVKRVKQKLTDKHIYEYFNFDDCDVILAVNGCYLACAEVPTWKNIITVAGTAIDGWNYPEDMLADKVVEKLSTSTRNKRIEGNEKWK